MRGDVMPRTDEYLGTRIEWLVIMRAEDWFTIYREWEGGGAREILSSTN